MQRVVAGRPRQPRHAMAPAQRSLPPLAAGPAAGPATGATGMPTGMPTGPQQGGARGGSELAQPTASMGNSDSRPGKGLLGRRTQSSGSLCTGSRSARTADKLGRLLAPCGRQRNQRGDPDHHRHHRYKFCGSLPNHLDSARQDGDNNNITPASPSASEKGRNGILERVLDLQDLGYASERSPDEEKHFPGDISGSCEAVVLQRGSRGLGLSVCGGADCASDGLVRIKRLFPHQPAWQSGRLRPGDVLLAVNGAPLSGLTNHEALEVLRTAPDHVVLTVARPSRPPSWIAPNPPSTCCLGPAPPAPPPPLQPPDPRTVLRQESCGELEVVLSKVQGSLGFTLRKEDSSALGHYVRALVREPALSDGRIRPGDKIVAVNGVDISHMSHEEAVMFLRQAGDTVVLRLYRDIAQTPVSALSPTEVHKAFRPKPLRKEALDMLSDLAVRRMAPQPGESSTLGRPRKVSDGRGGCPPSSQTSSKAAQRGRTKSFGEQASTFSRSQELIASSHGSRCVSREESPLVDLVDSTVSSSSLSSLSSCANSVVERPVRPRRPDFLELSNGPTSTSTSSATPHWHLQRLTTSPGPCTADLPSGPASPDPDEENWVDDGRLTDFASLPCSERGVGRAGRAGSVSAAAAHANFSHRNPAYQSALPACRTGATGPLSAGQGGRQIAMDPRACAGVGQPPQGSAQERCTGLLKWKGVVFTPEDEGDNLSSTPPDQDDTGDDTASQSTLEDSGGQVFTVELNRGWNSRLGFSLQSDGEHSVISAIYSDSVAAKNGRLRKGDRVIMVNDESVEGMETTSVIDLFRKIRGPIAITVWRKNDI